MLVLHALTFALLAAGPGGVSEAAENEVTSAMILKASPRELKATIGHRLFAENQVVREIKPNPEKPGESLIWAEAWAEKVPLNHKVSRPVLFGCEFRETNTHLKVDDVVQVRGSITAATTKTLKAKSRIKPLRILVTLDSAETKKTGRVTHHSGGGTFDPSAAGRIR